MSDALGPIDSRPARQGRTRWSVYEPKVVASPPGPKSRAILRRLERSVGRPSYAGLFGITLARGHGSYVWDVDDNCFLDCLAGASAAILGYGVGGVAEAQHWVAETLQHSCPPYSPDEQVVELAEALQALAPGDADTRVIFGSSGSDATGLAISAMRKFTGRLGVFCFRDAYHGSTGLSQQASGVEALKLGLYRSSSDLHSLSFPEDAETAERILDELEAGLRTGHFSGLIAEPVQSDAGVRMAAPGFFARAQEILRRYGALLIADEMQSGMGRTGTFFASEQEKVVPDLICLAKGLSAGYAPISALVGRKDVIDALAPAQEIFTYSGHGPSCAAARRCLEYIAEESLVDHVDAIGRSLLRRLEVVAAEYPDVIRGVRGRGLMIGLEIETAGAPWRAKAFATRGVELGVYLGFFGNANRVVRIEPPFLIEESGVTKIEETVCQIAREMRRNELPDSTLAKVLRYGVGL